MPGGYKAAEQGLGADSPVAFVTGKAENRPHRVMSAARTTRPDKWPATERTAETAAMTKEKANQMPQGREECCT